MTDSEVIDRAAEVFFKNAISQAIDKTFYNLQELLGITDGGYHFGTALHFDEHFDALVKDCRDIFNDQLMK